MDVRVFVIAALLVFKKITITTTILGQENCSTGLENKVIPSGMYNYNFEAINYVSNERIKKSRNQKLKRSHLLTQLSYTVSDELVKI